jgi:hypothetical protein
MGAFGNYYTVPKYQIDYYQNKPIEVVANFAPTKKYKPEYFLYITEDQVRHTFKIEYIKWMREYKDYDAFCCLYSNYGRQHEIILRYHKSLCIWTIPI